jgi:hypothetical protein
MEQLSGYEIAQKRIEERQRKRHRVSVWVVLMIVLTITSLIAGPRLFGCSVPLIVSFGFFAIMDGIQLYSVSSRRAPTPEMVDDQMAWLFGDDWRDIAGTQEYMLAQERIRRRRVRRSYFYLHLATFLLVNAGLLLLLIESFTRSTSAFGCMLLFPFIWLVFLAGHGFMVFPTRQRLVRQERQFGLRLQTELQQSIPEISKRKEKPKRELQYRIGEDGELEEVEDKLEDGDDKSKRNQES